MPFVETHVVDERRRFVIEVQPSLKSFSHICRRYGISRPTGYKWLERWESEGPPGLQAKPSRPRSSPWATPPPVVEAILNVRRTYEDYGAKKIIWFLERHRPELPLPSRTTVHNILLRHDLVPKRRKRLRRWHPGRPDSFAAQPNDTWSADFKGEFPTRDGELCYPLTVQDMHSRFVLDCRGRPNTKTVGVFPVFARLFREFGLPRHIRTDNGTPFATNTLGRLSRLSVWFIQLGIRPQLIEPGCPQQNGKHENMHLVLKRKTTRPPRANHRCQQTAFNAFCTEYNHIRPHEALDGAVPADLYEPSPRPFPKELQPITYPGHFETRLVSSNGGIRWYADRILVTTLLGGHHIGLEEIDQGLFNVYFGPVWLGHFFEKKRLILDSPDPRRTSRNRSGGNYKGRRTVKKVS
jgi:putative transposase